MHEDILSNNMLSQPESNIKHILVNWQPTIDLPLRHRALETIHVIAERLSKPDTLTAIVQEAICQSERFMWTPSSFPSGFGGLVLPFLYLARSFSTPHWFDVARRYMRLAAEATQLQPLVFPGLFNGSSGLAFVLFQLCQEETRYQKTYQVLNTNIATQVHTTDWYRNSSSGVAAEDYDIVSGAAGILAYLLKVQFPDERTISAIHKLLNYLIWLAGVDSEQERRRWYIPTELLPSSHRASYPDGNFNCGFAHGIPGPLAILALAWSSGYQLPGQQEAIVSLCNWLMEHQVRDEWGINWPNAIPLHLSNKDQDWSQLDSSRSAWCYGAPGIARSLWLAGKALNDLTLCNIAVNAIEGVLQRPISLRRIDSPTFCHGISGLLAICLRFAHETESLLIRQHISFLVKQILDAFNPEFPLGFRDEESTNIFVDDPGLMMGATGILLPLLSAATSTEPDWDRIFLLS